MTVSTNTRTIPDETRLCAMVLRRRLVTESQLKAALDYQRSLGGRLFDVLVKLNLIREHTIEQLVARLENETAAGVEPVGDDDVVSPQVVKPEDLKVHRKLLEKLPVEFVAQYLLVLFFPSASVNQRKIILGHGCELGPEVREKVKSTLGVDVCTLALDPEVARGLLKGNGLTDVPGRAETPPKPAAGPARTGSARTATIDAPKPALPQEAEQETEVPANERREAVPQGRSSMTADTLLHSLVSLLVKKGVIAWEEIEVELELSRIRRKARAPGAEK